MYINSEKQLIIDDKFICDFMYENGTKEFFATCESVIKSICISCGHNLKKENGNIEEIINRLDIFKGEFIESVSKRKIDLSDITKSMNDTNMMQLHEMRDIRNKLDKLDNQDNQYVIKTIEENIKNNFCKLDYIPKAIENIPKAIENLSNKIDTGKLIENGFKNRNEYIESNINTLQHSIDKLSNKFDQQAITRSTNKYKGNQGEQGLTEVLEDILPLREGYEIIETKTIAHSCDLNIKRIGYPDIRVECKAHGFGTNEPVRTRDVKKFEDDIIGLKSHGIFVSLYSGIVGKSQIEIDLLHTNKFAVYISNNNYDGKIIRDYVQLIYKLDSILANLNSDGNFKISNESMMAVKNYLNDFNNKINA